MHQKFTLDNGLRLITTEMAHTRSVSIVFFIGAGVCYETDSEAGTSHFIEHLCFKGTKRRKTSKEISEAIEGIGGVLNGGTDKELTVFWCKVASQHFEEAVDVLVDLLRNSRFDTQDIDRERQVIIEEINMSLDSPQQRVDMLIDELLWPEQPLGRDSAGKKETVANLRRQQLRNYFHGHYLPNNTVISIAGNIEQERVQQIIQSQVGNWKPGIVAPRFSSKVKQRTPKMRVEKRDTEQVNLCLGVHGLSLLNADRFVVDLLSMVLGEGMSSRLFIEIRENQGLAYDISSCTSHFIDSGAFFINAGVDPNRLNDTLKATVKELTRVRDGISEMELHKAKEMAKGRLLLALEDSRIVANWFGAQEMLTNRILTVDDVISLIGKITTDDLRRVAQQLFTSNKLSLAVVGPVDEGEGLIRMLKI